MSATVPTDKGASGAAGTRPSVLSVCDSLAFDLIIEACDLAASYAGSASEAAYRGDKTLLATHLAQLRLSTITALQTFKQHVTPTTDENRTAA